MRRTQKNFFLRGDTCCYCERPMGNGLEFTKEHIIPKSKGGTDALSNLTPCCIECNQFRGDMTLAQFKTVSWVVLKILNGKFSLNEFDIRTIYNNLYERSVTEELQGDIF